MEKPYAIVNSSNVVVNVTIWDGNTETWQPDTGETAIDIGDDTGVMIGMTYNSSGTGTVSYTHLTLPTICSV